MSRFKRFAYSLASGYVALAANIAYTLLSVPLALHYLGRSPSGRAQFGLYLAVMQVAGFIALIDLGMSGVSRLLIDHKDDKRTGRYGGFIKATLLVSAIQGMAILVAGMGVGLWLGATLGVPRELEREFYVLMLGQSAVVMGGFMTRVLQYMLAAHQRYDVWNYGSVGSFAASLSGTWLGFHLGYGVYSLLWGNLAGFVVLSAMCFGACIRLRLFPPAGAWGRITWPDFREMFVYGWDIFVFMLGGQLIAASQTILVARTLGLEAAALWGVCSRSFTLVQQITFRLFDYSCSALAEMLVRGEKERLLRRFRSIVMVSSSVAAIAAVMFACCNQPFVEIWSHGQMGWAITNDLLLAVWLLFGVQVRSHTGLVGQAKEFGALRYVFFVEGAVFVALALTVLRSGGVTAMVGASIVATALISYPYGIWRTARFFGLNWREIALAWVTPACRTMAILGPIGVVAWWWTREWPAPAALAVRGLGLGALGVLVLFRWGLEQEFQREILNRSPARIRTWTRWLGLEKTLA